MKMKILGVGVFSLALIIGLWSYSKAAVNLIQNPSVETASANPTLPLNWLKGGWGTNNRLLTYPATGYDGVKAVKVEITAYTNGDAKWYFQSVPATPGQTYTFSDSYISSAPSFVTVQLKMANGTFTYLNTPQVAASPTAWNNIQRTFTVPANATSMTVFHGIKQVGYLTADNFSLTLGTPPPTDTTPPTVSISGPLDGTTSDHAEYIHVHANISDNVGVVSSVLLVDGNIVPWGSPYFRWWIAGTAYGPHTLIVQARDAAGNVGNSAPITVTIAPDTTLPTASITSPVAGATVSGSTTVSIIGSDTNIRNLTFLVDGNVVFSQGNTPGSSGVRAASLQLDDLWNTTGITNGQHILTAQASDASGNIGTSTPITVTVANTLPPHPPLTLPFLDNFNDGNTDGWWLGYSQHTPSVAGNWRVENLGFPQEGVLVQDNGADHFIALVENIQVSNQIVEAKLNFKQGAGYGGITVWYEDDNHWVNVLIYPASGIIRILEDGDTVAGTTYPYSSSNDTWYNLKVMANSTTGELDVYVDGAYVLTHTVTTTHRIGLSGVNSGNSGGYFDDFKINYLPPPPPTNLVLNPSFEVAGTAGNPANWTRSGWGSNNRTFTYPTVGADGNKAVKVTISSYTNGDAKWYFNDVPVIGGNTYTFSESYKSTVPTEIDLRYKIGTATQYSFLVTLPASPTWTTFSRQITIPANVTALSALHIIYSAGSLETDAFSLTAQ